MKLSEYTHVHCIGIGGIGISAIARYCKSKGAVVTGSDGGTSRITDDLQKEGMTVYKGHDVNNLSETIDLVIYTIAVTDTNVELKNARAKGITCMTYPEALGMLTKEYTTIAVCGTHGKTTTTAMVASMLTSAGKKPTVIVGSLLAGNGTNFVEGDSDYLVVEACEYKRSFLNLHPIHILVTNIDEDHLDYYKDIYDIESAFQEFTDKLPKEGTLITHSDVNLSTLARKINADTFDKETIELSVLGDHNKQNAQLALALADALGLDHTKAREGLRAFTGTWRRLEYKGTQKGAIVYDDYGHHPTEIQATLQALREKYISGKFKLIVVFQPHLFSRTKLLLKEFSEAFSLADTICILPIYKAREVDDGTISSHDLVEITDNAIYMETFEEVKKYLDKNAHSGSVVLTIGAGDVYLLSDIFITEEQK
ncbi:MAG: UDP-N-acetylmuramate--L-alanine ligase [Candidatus Pacebacteria bacterium]|nr:UDP-N-acetylmuramate--L-alanine ligase [Candidatus Paceibacterota bacterium]MBP9866503.1 UDP-N-acetylmuramate--L-alanine ligase [Candidatus Paceibacterota bacterium]